MSTLDDAIAKLRRCAAVLDLTPYGEMQAPITIVLDALEARTALLKQASLALDSAVAIASEAAEEWDKAPSGMRAGKILLALCGHVNGYRADITAFHDTRATVRRSLSETPDTEGVK